jgi:hypothetical protein
MLRLTETEQMYMEFASSEMTVCGHVFKLQSCKSCDHAERVYVNDNILV